MCIDRKWYSLGRFRILAKPLELNPHWVTHHIYFKGKLVGKQLSVPTLSDCEWHEAIAGRDENYTPQPYIDTSRYVGHRRAGRGRPRKDVSARELAEALAG